MFKVNGHWVNSEIQQGDKVELANGSMNLPRDIVHTVIDRKTDGSDYEREPESGTYVYVGKVRIRIAGYSNWYSAINFRKTDRMPTLQIEANKPTRVIEFTESLVDGKMVRTEIGNEQTFDNLSAAKLYTSSEISASIRKDNEYRKFAVFQEVFVAQAKQPEVEFV